MDLQVIKDTIFNIRGQRIMIDIHLAELYDVEVRVLNQAVKRNIDRFPADFMFQLTKTEWTNLKSQIVTSSWGGRRTLPFAFTEQGVAMLAGILRSKKAVQVNIEIMRAFVLLRKMSLQYAEITEKMDALESKYSSQFAEVFTVLKHLLDPEISKKERIKIGYKK
ncbi:MAG: ORF6N domain-containing protein [Polaribacter sp.]|nr:ORF6N domain-containing protein [Polaribacter sp.]